LYTLFFMFLCIQIIRSDPRPFVIFRNKAWTNKTENNALEIMSAPTVQLPTSCEEVRKVRSSVGQR
jgi:hypothetical protein